MSDSKEEIRQAYQREEDTSKAVFIPAKERTSIYSENSPFIACAYCRVSTDNEEQTSSFELQQKHDQIKRDYCKNNGIKLLEITYKDNIEKVLTEWYNSL